MNNGVTARPIVPSPDGAYPSTAEVIMRHWLGAILIAAFTLGTGCGGEITGEPSGTTGGGGSPATMPAPTTSPALTTLPVPVPTPGPPFASVFNDVLMPHGCVSSYCHDLVVGTLGAMGDAYAHLVNVASTGEGCGGMKLVAPGDPEHSLLYLKVSLATPPCGVRMPDAASPLDGAEVDAIRAWIEGGAAE
jgi:hypothetical protein